MPIIGYCDRLTVEPGDKIRFMVSSDFPRYRADLVRLIHGDDNPKGPGLKEEVVGSAVSGEYTGRRQSYPKGSYVRVTKLPRRRSFETVSIQAWIYPTTPTKGVQGLVTSWAGDGTGGFGLFIDERGALAMALRDASGTTEWVSTGRQLRAATWYLVLGSYRSSGRKVSLRQVPVSSWPRDKTMAIVERTVSVGEVTVKDPILIAAYWSRDENGERVATGHFNGKIERPRLFSRALTMREADRFNQGISASRLKGGLIADWDFSRSVETDTIVDTSGHGLGGKTLNSPKRAVTGHNWTGRDVDFRRAPDQYGAIYFHDDDLDDCRWSTDFELTVPRRLKSGVYAARLMAGTARDYVPFFVRPSKGRPTSRIAFLAPTLSYLAYANDHAISRPDLRAALGLPDFGYPVRAADKYLVRTNLLSLYDRHTDGSGVCYASRLRPLLTMRPNYIEASLGNGKGSPHQFSADLCLLDWMEAKGFRFDVITDEDLHSEGARLLVPYKVVVSGTHPEYWTERMLDGLQAYLKDDGRFMYLGGNGLYWVTSIDPKRPHIAEVRRWGGTQNWRSEPGEFHHSSTGEIGGLWRNRGRPPQKLVGVGFTAEGFDRNAPYRRSPDSFNEPVAFIFEGIGKDELIGDFECLTQHYGSAGYEIDRFDLELGTPAHALLLASASGFSNSYQHVVEEVDVADSKQGGPVNPKVRADIVYFEYPNGGAVFSVGSIAWCGCLSFNKYENNVSRVTENVLRKFSTSERP